jgi:filamentous hemagglutinin family protein
MIQARRRRRRIAGYILTAVAMMNLVVPPVARAAPAAGQDVKVDRVVRGDVRLNRDGVRTNIHASHNAIIDYQRFNVPRGQEVRFIQPSRDSRVLNRVLSNDPSKIDGVLRANGVVYLVNPSGVIFGPGSVIDVGRMYAAAGRLSDGDFLAGADRFTHMQGTVRQQGALDALDGVALIGRRVINGGHITTQRGTVVLASGDRVYLAEQGSRVMVRVDNLDVDTGRGAGGNRNVTDKTGVVNHGGVSGDEVVFAAGDVYGLAIHNAGRITADRVALTGHGRVTQAGDITASGGQVQLLGEQVGHMAGTIDVSGDSGGIVLLGGDYQGRGPLRNASATVVERGATILADARDSAGDPGRVIVWSDDTTRFMGIIRARGESEGGFAEVSGKRYLDYRGFTDLRSFDGGAVGTLLLDPHNLTIRTAGPDAGVTAGSPFSTTADNAVLTVASIEAALALADVLIQTSAGGAQQGDVTIQNAITHPGGATRLTIEAHRHINLNADINFAANAATGLLSLRADSDANGTGSILDGGGTLRLNGGPLQLLAGSGIGTNANRIQTTGVTNFAASSNTGGVFINNTGSNVHVTTVNGTVGLSAISSGTASIHTDGDLLITSAASSPNNLVLRTTGGAITGSVALNANSLTLAAATGITDGLGGNLAISTGILDVTNTTSGDIRLLETNAISVHRIDQQGPGLTMLSTINGDIDLTAGQSGVAAGSGAVSLTAGGAGALISVNAPINTVGGSLSLTGANRVTFSGAGDVTTGGGDFTVTATGADIAMNSGTAVNAGAGLIALTANTNIGLGALTTTNATTAAVTLTAGGAINDIGAGTEVSAVNGRLVINAGSGVGSANALEISVASLDIQNGNNNIGITEANNVDVVRMSNSGAGAITLTSTAGAIHVTAAGTGVSANAGAVSLTARDGMTLDQNVTTTGGVITLHADTNAAGAGDLTIGNGVTVSTGAGAGAITVTALDIAFGAGSLVNAGTGDITLIPSVATRTIGVGDGAVGQFHIDTTEMTQRLATSGTLTIGAAAGTGAVDIPALDLSGEAFSLSVRGGAMTPSAITMAVGRNLSLTSNGSVGMTIGDDLAAPGGTITLAANRLDLQPGATVTADAVTLRNATAGTAIDIGSTTDAALNTLEISNDELGRIVTGAFVLGSTTAGPITITDALTAAVTPTLHLIGGSTVTQTPGSSISVTNLAIGGGGSVTLTEAGNNVGTLAINLSGAGQVTYTDADSFTVGTVHGVTGITLGTSGLSTLTAASGMITMTTPTTGGGGSLALLADKIDIQAGGAINTGAGHLTLAPATAGVPVLVGNVGDATANTLELSDAELDRVTTTGTGTLRIGSATAGDVTLTAALTNSTAANVHLISPGLVSQNAGATVNAANFAVTADRVALGLTNNVTGLAANVTGAAEPFTWTDSDGFTVRAIDGVGGVLTNGGAISLTAGAGDFTLTHLAGATIASGGADIALIANRMNLQAGSAIDAGAARVTLRTATAGRQIRLGNSDSATRLGLTDDELDTITAGTLTIGAANAGQVLVDALINPANVSTLHLHSNSTISGAGQLEVTNLAMRSAGAITLDHAAGNNVANLAAAVTNAGAAFTFANAGDLTIGNVDGVSGITTNGAGITLRTLAVNSRFTNTAAIASGAGNITLDVNRVDLQPGSTITATGGTTVTIRNRNAGTAFDLGSATDLAHDTIELSAAELGTISAAGLVLGRTTAGAMAITEVIAPPGVTTLSLVSGGAITQLPAAGITATNLMVQAGDDVTLTAPGNNVNTLAATVSGAGGFAFTDADGFTVNTVNGVNGVTTAGGDVALTALTGRITTSRTVAGGGGDITLVADQMAINAAGTINAGTGDVSLAPSTAGHAIDLGSTLDTTPGTLELSAAEMDRITAASIRIGDGATGAITVTAPIAPAGSDALFLHSGAADITQTAGSTLTVSHLTLASAGHVTLTQANDVDTLAADLTAGQGALQFTDANGVALAGIATDGGLVAVNAAGLLANTDAVTSGGGDIVLSADRMALAGGTMDADAGRVTLRPLTAGRPIDVGSTTDLAAALELSDAEVNTIRAGTLVIGHATSGNLTLSDDVTFDPARLDVLHLASGATISGVGALAVERLAVTADTVALSGDHAVDVLASQVSGAAAGFVFSNSQALTLSSVDGVAGVTTQGGDIAITVDGLFTNANAIASNDGDVTLAADRMALSAGTVDAGAGMATLRPLTAGRAVHLGSTTDLAAALELSDAELDSVTASVLAVGGVTAGPIIVTNAVSRAGVLQLTTSGSVTQLAPLATDALAVDAAGAVTLTHAGNAIDVLAARITTAGEAITIRNAADMVVGSVAGIDGVTTADGAIDLTVAGTLGTTHALIAGTGDVTLTADDVAIAAAVTGTGTLTLQPRLATTSIGVGDGAGDFSLDAAELALLTDGFAAIHLGRADGEHAITLGPSGATFTDPLAIRAPVGSGAITIDGTLRGDDNASITIDGPGATTHLHADIVTAGGDILISDSVVVGDGLTVTLDSAGGDIRITGTSHSVAAATLVFDAATGHVTLDDAVTGALSIRLADAADVTVTAFNTTGSLTSGNALTGSFTATGRLTTGLIDLAGVDFDVQQGLASSGITRFDHSGTLTITGQHSTSVGAFTATGDTELAVNLTTADNNLTIAGPLTLLAGVELATGAGAGDITLSSIDGAHALTLQAGTGAIHVQQNIGDATALASLTATATDIAVENARTTGTQSYTSATTTMGDLTTTGGAIAIDGDALLRGDTTLSTGAGAGAITITGNMDGHAPGADALLLDAGTGAITIGGSTGSATPLAHFTADGATVSVGPVTTTADQSYRGATTLHGDLIARDIDLHSATRLGSDLTITSAGGEVTFHSTLNGLAAGQQQLAIDAGAGRVTFAAGVGALAALEGLDVTAADIRLGHVTTAIDQRYDGAVTLAGHTTLTAGRDVRFTATVDGNLAGVRDLTVTAGRDVTLTGDAGAAATLRTIAINADTLTLAGVTTTGEQQYQTVSGAVLAGDLTTTGVAESISLAGPVMLGADIAATTAGGDLTFGGTLNGSHAMAIQLGTGDLALVGHAGQLQRLGALAITQARDIHAQRSLHASSIHVIDAREVLLGGTVTTDGGGITVAARRDVTVGGAIDTRTTAAGQAGGHVDLRTTGGHITVNAIRTDGTDGAANGQAGGNAGYILFQPDSGVALGGAGPDDWRPDGRLVLLGAISAIGGRGNNAPDGGGGQVFLSPFGRASVPSVATIHSNPTAGGLSITATGNVIMGQNEKLVVPGGNSNSSNAGVLSIRSLGGDIHVGDLAARRSITLTADQGSVVLLTRASGGVLQRDGTVVRDNGLDVYASQSITFNAPIQLGGVGGRKPEFATKDPANISVPPVGDPRFVILRYTGSDTFVDSQGVVLDIAAGGEAFTPPGPITDPGLGVTELIAGASRVSGVAPSREHDVAATALWRMLDAFVSERSVAFGTALGRLVLDDAVAAFMAGEVDDDQLLQDVATIAAMLDEADRLPLAPARIEAVKTTILDVVTPSTATPHTVTRLVDAWRGRTPAPVTPMEFAGVDAASIAAE